MRTRSPKLRALETVSDSSMTPVRDPRVVAPQRLHRTRHALECSCGPRESRCTTPHERAGDVRSACLRRSGMLRAMQRSSLAAVFLFGCPADGEGQDPLEGSRSGTAAGTMTAAEATSTDSSGVTAGDATTGDTTASTGPEPTTTDPSTGAD